MSQLNFFNTISLAGDELIEAVETCNKQEQRVLDLMKRGVPYTPIQVHGLYCNTYNPTQLTSVRRAMTCLTDKKYLEKLPLMKNEVYGKPNHLWIKR